VNALVSEVEGEASALYNVASEKYDETRKHTVELSEEMKVELEQISDKLEDFIAKELKGFQAL